PPAPRSWPADPPECEPPAHCGRCPDCTRASRWYRASVRESDSSARMRRYSWRVSCVALTRPFGRAGGCRIQYPQRAHVPLPGEVDLSGPTVSRRRVLQGLAAASLPLALPGCAEKKANSLIVGGLPVTCNLTLPVACVGRATVNAKAAAGGPKYEYEYN